MQFRGAQAATAALSTRRMSYATPPIPPVRCRMPRAPIAPWMNGDNRRVHELCQGIACILKLAATFAFSGIAKNANSLRRPPARGGLCFGLGGRRQGPEGFGLAWGRRGGRERRARPPAVRRRGVEHGRAVL